MTEATLLARIALGEHTRQQFKRTFNSPDACNLRRVQGDQGFNSPPACNGPRRKGRELANKPRGT